MNVVVTSTPTTIKVDFNDFSTPVRMVRASFRRDEISEVIEVENSKYIVVVMLDGNEFNLSTVSHQAALVVDTIDGNPPIDNADLFDKLITLQQV